MPLTDWLATREPYSPLTTPPGIPARVPTRRGDPLWPYALCLLTVLIGGLLMYLFALVW